MAKKFYGDNPEDIFNNIISEFKKKVEKEAVKELNAKLNPAEVKLAKKYKKLYNKPLNIQPFTIETIRKAYQQTDLTPSQGIYYINSSGNILLRAYIDDEKELACPMGALAVSRDNSLLELDGESWREGVVGQLIDVPGAFVHGFIQGFDNADAPFKGVSPWVIQGYENGRAILEEMIKSGEIIPAEGTLLEEPPAKDSLNFDIKELLFKPTKPETPTLNESESFKETTDEDIYAEEEENYYSSLKEVLANLKTYKEIDLIELNKPVGQFFLDALHRLPELDLVYLLITRFGEKRYTVKTMIKEISENTKLGQQFVLELLTIATNTLADETERLPFKYGNLKDHTPLPKYQKEEDSED